MDDRRDIVVGCAMEMYHKYKSLLNVRRFLAGCFVWWLATGLLYAVLNGRITSAAKSETETGIELTGQYAERLGLSVLERNVASIQALLDDAARHEIVVFVSVFDHEDRLIASAGAQKLLVAPESKTAPPDRVDYSAKAMVMARRSSCGS